MIIKNDGFVKSRKTPFFVIPAEAGIQSFQMVKDDLDSGFHRSDDFLRVHQKYSPNEPGLNVVSNNETKYGGRYYGNQ